MSVPNAQTGRDPRPGQPPSRQGRLSGNDPRPGRPPSKQGRLSGNDPRPGRPPSRQGWRLRVTRRGSAAVLAAALGLGVAACGGTSTASPGSSAGTPSGRPSGGFGGGGFGGGGGGGRGQISSATKTAFASCMHSHGDKSFKFPSSGSRPAAGGGLAGGNQSSAFQSAFSACRSVLFGGSGG